MTVVLPDRLAVDDWDRYARCADMPTAIWFPERPEKGSHTESPGYRVARAYCRDCPVRMPCLVRAIRQETPDAERSQRYGMQGGTKPTERHAIARKLRTVHPAAWGPVIVALLAELDERLDRKAGR